jgi:hypothetical protein
MTVKMDEEETSELSVGWQVTKALDAEYWLDSEAEAGKHSREHVVSVPAPTIAHHTVIVAQSGSGKSFFLGRYIEEILLKTKSRILILDPNSDFRRISETVPPDKWIKPKYDLKKRIGFLPDEPSREAFMARWGAIKKIIHSKRIEKDDSKSIEKDNSAFKLLQFNWLRLSMELLAEDISSELQNELRHCHSFVNALAALIVYTKPPSWHEAHDLLETARKFCEDTRKHTRAELISRLEEQFPADTGKEESGQSGFVALTGNYVALGRSIPALSASLLERASLVAGAKGAYPRAAIHRSFVSEGAERFYFGTAFAVKEQDLIAPTLSSSFEPTDARLQVVDLPSVRDPQLRHMVMSTFLDTAWAEARERWEGTLSNEADKDMRVPTFIVVDEAHNVIPAEPKNPTQIRLQEQFRTVAAEGRKFGVFLILVSQRPDKLDPLVLSECENRAVMRMGSDVVLRKTNEVLGLDIVPVRMTQRCLEFDIGRALLFGPWADDNPVFLFSMARRTEEGGRNLRPQHWAVPYKTEERKTLGAA